VGAIGAAVAVGPRDKHIPSCYDPKASDAISPECLAPYLNGRRVNFQSISKIDKNYHIAQFNRAIRNKVYLRFRIDIEASVAASSRVARYIFNANNRDHIALWIIALAYYAQP
jgi:hypothetical protein